MKAIKLPLSAFFMLFFLITFKAGAQEKDDQSKILVINPIGVDEISRKLKINTRFKFKINNVNSIKLNGYTASKPFNFETDAPTVFKDTKLPAGTEKVEEKIKKEENKVDSVMHAMSEVNRKMLNITSFMKSDAFSDTEATALKKQIASLKEQLKQLTTELAKMKNGLKKLQDELSSGFYEHYTSFIDSYQRIQRVTSIEDSLYAMLPEVVIPNVAVLKSNTENYIRNAYGVSSTDALENTLMLTLKNLNAEYTALKGAYQALNKEMVTDTLAIEGQLKNKEGSFIINMTKGTALVNLKPKFLEEFNNATKIFNTLKTGDNQTKLFNKAYKGIALFRTIQSEEFAAYTNSQQLTDDELQVTPSLKNSKGTVVKEFNPVTIKAYGGIKVNFTTGYLITFRGDENYSYYSEGSPAAIKGVVKQKSNDLTNAIGALAHAYYRTASGVTGGLSGGFSLTNNGDIGFYLGASGFFLEKNRLALTAGVSFVKVNILNTGNLNAVSGDASKYTFNSAETKINYDSLYKPGFFVGITYNIFGNASKTETAK